MHTAVVYSERMQLILSLNLRYLTDQKQFDFLRKHTAVRTDTFIISCEISGDLLNFITHALLWCAFHLMARAYCLPFDPV